MHAKCKHDHDSLKTATKWEALLQPTKVKTIYLMCCSRAPQMQLSGLSASEKKEDERDEPEAECNETSVSAVINNAFRPHKCKHTHRERRVSTKGALSNRRRV